MKREAAAIGEFRSWSSCTVPLTVVANREHYGDGHQEIWCQGRKELNQKTLPASVNSFCLRITTSLSTGKTTTACSDRSNSLDLW